MTPASGVRSIIALVLVAVAAAAGAADFSAFTLRGVRTVAVQVDGVHADFARYGVVGERLAAQVEARLRAAGVEVVSARQAHELPHAALLEVTFRVQHHAHDYLHYYPYAVSVKLKQKLPLPSAEQAFVAETVWSDGRNGVEAPIHLSRLNGYVLALLEHFIADLEADNRG